MFFYIDFEICHCDVSMVHFFSLQLYALVEREMSGITDHRDEHHTARRKRGNKTDDMASSRDVRMNEHVHVGHILTSK